MLEYIIPIILTSIITFIIGYAFGRWMRSQNKRVEQVSKTGIGIKDDTRALFESKDELVSYFKDKNRIPFHGLVVGIKVNNEWISHMYTTDNYWKPLSGERPSEILQDSTVICTGNKYPGLRHQVFKVAKIDGDRMWLYNHGGNGYISVRKDQFSLYI